MSPPVSGPRSRSTTKKAGPEFFRDWLLTFLAAGPPFRCMLRAGYDSARSCFCFSRNASRQSRQMQASPRRSTGISSKMPFGKFAPKHQQVPCCSPCKCPQRLFFPQSGHSPGSTAAAPVLRQTILSADDGDTGSLRFLSRLSLTPVSLLYRFMPASGQTMSCKNAW